MEKYVNLNNSPDKAGWGAAAPSARRLKSPALICIDWLKSGFDCRESNIEHPDDDFDFS